MTLRAISNLQAAVERAVEEEGQKGFSQRAGVPLGVVRQARRAGNLTAESIAQLSKALGLDFYVGPYRDGDERPPPTAGPAPDFGFDLSGEDYTAISLRNVEASAGPGRLPEEEEPIGALAFRQTWLQREGINPDRASVIRVRGDSMWPTLLDGDIVLVRHDAPGLAEGKIRKGGIYVFRAEGHIHVKRLFQSGARIVATSDNLQDEPMVFNASNPGMHLIGDVVWCGRKMDGVAVGVAATKALNR